MGKEFSKAYRYAGELEKLLDAVQKSINQMGLIVKDKSIGVNSFSLTLSEKMKWLTTNWPVHFKIEANKIEETFLLMVKTSCKLVSITQDFYTQQKAQEFLDLVKSYAAYQEVKPSESIATTQDIPRKPCPMCGEMIAQTAKICRYCKSNV